MHIIQQPTQLILLLLITLLTACGSQPGPTEKPVKQHQSSSVADNRSIQELLVSAERADPARSQGLRILAASKALDQGNTNQAAAILALVSEPILTAGRDYVISQARLSIQQKSPELALGWLADPRATRTPLTTEDQLELGNLKSRAYRLNRSYLASARERIFFDSLLTEEQKQDNHDEIFDTLMGVPAKTLADQAEKAVTSDLRGWLSLAAMSRRYQNDPLLQLQSLQDWRKLWSHHPAALLLPRSLELLSRVVSEQPKSIALVLPLQGSLSLYGRAIRDGIIGAHFQTAGKADIRVYDSGSGDINDIIRKAKADGAELVIGPLDREKVTSLARAATLPLPVLALNRSLEPAANSDLYQFGLAPEDEIRQVTQQAALEGKRNALVIYPSDDWGLRNFETFKSQWQQLNGNIIDSTEYTNQRDYSDLVKHLLEVDNSEKRAADLRRILGERFEFTPRRRQDIDFIFLLANTSQARGINPTLAFFYAEDIPVYATSSVYEYSENRIESIDLNGIRFCDIPWKLGDPDSIQRRIEQAWPNSKSQLAAFYALGVDAYRLFPRLQQLKSVETEKVYGVTGILQLDRANTVTRQLMWAQVKNGEIVTIPLIVESGV